MRITVIWTNCGRVIHICVTYMRQSSLVQIMAWICWNIIVNWIHRNKLQWYFDRDSYTFIPEYAFQKSSVKWRPFYKAGDKLLPDIYRGITILPIFEKIFEMAVYEHLSFVNEALNKIDPCNGGFTNDSRTSDNLFILNGLIERQSNMGHSLYVCFIDFSFDLVNRDILFYKVVKMERTGRAIDTLRNLYSKTNIRVNHKGEISSSFESKMGVNQGGVLSGLLFRK